LLRAPATPKPIEGRRGGDVTRAFRTVARLSVSLNHLAGDDVTLVTLVFFIAARFNNTQDAPWVTR
jgi:hypothetical protein